MKPWAMNSVLTVVIVITVPLVTSQAFRVRQQLLPVEWFLVVGVLTQCRSQHSFVLKLVSALWAPLMFNSVGVVELLARS